MKREHVENEILLYALDAFKKNIALPVDIEKEKNTVTRNLRVDCLLRIWIQDTELNFYTEVKTKITKAELGIIMLQKGKYPSPMLLVTKYVTAQMAERLNRMKSSLLTQLEMHT